MTPPPSLESDEVVVGIEAVGICGSDMHAYHGHDPRRKPGLILGHEFAGKVLQSQSKLWKVGQRVTGNPLIVCGSCKYCLQGRDNLCANRTMVGMTRPGAFAEQMSIPGASLIAIPDSLLTTHAALTEPAATAVHAVELALKSLVTPLSESRVLVVGGGAIGILSALLLVHKGATHLTVAETNALRTQTLRRHARADLVNPIEEAVEPASFDLVIDAVGSAKTRSMDLEAVAPGGVVMHIGLQDWASEIDMRKLTLAEITLLGTYTYTMNDLRKTVQQLDRGDFGSLEWLDVRPLKDGVRAVQDLDQGKSASPKILLCP
ncbi:MAG: alcohol dehydrogenase catalytic domain-containing protein [Burkholderiaceae bacterium]